MSSGWSIFVVVLTIANILGCFWLLRWTAKPKHAGEKIGGGSDTGHTWDGDLREYNNPLPKWWLWLFYITIVFALIYLAAAVAATLGGAARHVTLDVTQEESWRAAIASGPFATVIRDLMSLLIYFAIASFLL